METISITEINQSTFQNTITSNHVSSQLPLSRLLTLPRFSYALYLEHLYLREYFNLRVTQVILQYLYPLSISYYFGHFKINTTVLEKKYLTYSAFFKKMALFSTYETFVVGFISFKI